MILRPVRARGLTSFAEPAHYCIDKGHMKIAFIHQPIGVLRLPANDGSIEIWTYEVARRLAKSCEVIVYSRRAPGQDELEVRNGVRYHRVSTGIDELVFGVLERHPKIQQLPGIRDPKRPLFAFGLGYMEYSLKVARDLKRQGCDLVHISNFSQIVPVVRAFNPRTKIVLHMQCEWLTQLDAQVIERRLRKCDLVIGCSEYITDKVRRAFPRFASKCRTVYNGVDVNSFVPGENSTGKNSVKRLLFVGRIWADKGPHVLLEALKKVVERHPLVQLEFVGGKLGPPPGYVVRLSDDEKVLALAPLYNTGYFSHLQRMLTPDIASRVSFHKVVPHPELAAHYRMADILVFPSVWPEPFGIPIVEAMASGIPVIATRGGGFVEIVEEGKTGLLVERGNAPALADAMLRLLEDDNLRKSMGATGRQEALAKFSWERIAQDVLYRYSTICDDPLAKRVRAGAHELADARRG